MSQRERPEPKLGPIDDLGADRRARPSRPGRRGPAGRRRARAARRWPWLLVLLLLALAAAAVYLQREQLRSYFPASQTREWLNDAARAESEERWHDPAGEGALELYRRVLDDDPDNDAARLGLSRVGARLADQADAALDAGDKAQAERLIELLVGIGMPGDRVAGLRARLQVRRAEGAALSGLLAQAQDALARERIRGDRGALALFGRMLAADPDNAVARRGVDDAVAVLVGHAGRALDEGRIEAAEELAEAASRERALHADLPPLRQRIADARAEQAERAEALARAEQARSAAEIDALLARAGQHLRAGRLGEAVDAYREADERASKPLPAIAQGLAQVARAALEQARQALADSDAERAGAVLNIARRAGADPDEIGRLEASRADLAERLAAVLARPQLDERQQRRLDDILARAVAADERGDLVEPAGASAYDLYRQVLLIDPMHEQARHAVTALPRRAQDLAALRMQLDQLDEADAAIQALQAMSPRNAALPELRRQLAGAWLERGDRALREGAEGEARRALQQARALAPDHPGIARLSQRITGG